MRTKLILASMAILAIGAAAYHRNAPPSAKTHVYAVEYLKAPTGGVPLVNMTFYEKIDKATAQSQLKQQFQWMVDAYRPTTDVLAYAWDAKEDQIGDGLAYIVKDNKIIPTSQMKH